MAKVCRDVLIVSRLAYMSEEALELELNRINRLLFNIETLASTCLATEIIDVPRHKIIRKQKQVMEVLGHWPKKAFLFAFNRN